MRELETMLASIRVCGQIHAVHPVSPLRNDTNDVHATLSARYQRMPPKLTPKLPAVNYLPSYSKSYEIVTINFFDNMEEQITFQNPHCSHMQGRAVYVLHVTPRRWASLLLAEGKIQIKA